MATLLVDRVAIVFPKIVVVVWKFEGFNDGTDGLHDPSPAAGHCSCRNTASIRWGYRQFVQERWHAQTRTAAVD